MNAAQKFILDSRMLESGFSVVLQLPTGSGKTWLARRAIHHVLKTGRRAIYLTPLRALADELKPAWEPEFAPNPVGIFTGDYGINGKEYPVPFSKARVLIMTPERLDACTRNWRTHWHWLPEVDLVVVDEVHLLGDRHRGARLEGAISRLRRLNPFCRFLCLSATLGNREELADWLGALEYSSECRPVPLSWRIERYRKAIDKPELLTKEVAASRDAGGRSLVFVQSRRRAETLAALLRQQGLRAAFHHAGLTHKARRKTEQSLRSSELDALVATGTLEMGLNMPVRQVILYDTQAFDGCRFSPLAVNTVWQRAGRAGRPGLDPSGEVVLFAAAWERGADSYPDGKFERIESQLATPAPLAEQVLAEVASGLCRSEVQLKRAIGTSLAAFQEKVVPTERILQEMIEAGMIKEVEQDDKESEGKVRLAPTPLGRIATRQMLQPATILKMRRLLEMVPDFTFFDLLVGLGLTADCEPIILVDFEELPTLAARFATIRANFPARSDELRSSLGDPTGKRLLSALKTAALLMDWTANGTEAKVAKSYGVYPFEVRRLCECFDRLLMACAAVCHLSGDQSAKDGDVGKRKKSPATQRIELLRHMIRAGLPQEAASLTFIAGIGAKWARKLCASGYSNLELLAAASTKDLGNISGLSPKRAERWIYDAKRIAQEPRILENQGPLLAAFAAQQDASKDYDRYRMRRARDLSVTNISSGEYLVAGGLEPHRVMGTLGQWSCDCADFSKGHICKHILAARNVAAMDVPIENRKETTGEGTVLDLSSLWSEP